MNEMMSRKITCSHCDFEADLAASFVEHIMETGHCVPPEIYGMMLVNKEFRDELIAQLIAVQTCNSPEEIGATKVKEDG